MATMRIHCNGPRLAGVEEASKALRAMPAWQANPQPIVVWQGLAAVHNLGGVAQRLFVGLNRPGL